MKNTLIIISLLFISAVSYAQDAISVKKTGSGHVVIFLPGFTSPGSVWDTTIADLDGSFESHTVTYAGFGGVAPIETPWYPQLLAGLKAYVTKEKLRSFSIVGHSMGGNLAVDLAAAFPDRLKGLVLIESLPCMRELMMPGVPASSLQYDSPYNDRMLSMNEQDFSNMASGMSMNMTFDSTKVKVLTDWAKMADRKTYVYGYTDLLKLDLRPTLADISIKTLILGASFPDEAMVMGNYEKQYDGLKNKQIQLAEGSKHFIMFDQSNWLNEQLNSYLNDYAQ